MLSLVRRSRGYLYECANRPKIRRVKNFVKRLLGGLVARFIPRAVMTAADNFETFERAGYHVTAANFYAPIPRLSDLASGSPAYSTEGLALALEEQRRTLRRLRPFFAEYVWEPNTFFSRSDSLVLYAMIRHLRPAKIVEVGSGFSTRATLAAIEQNGSGELITIEPFQPERMPMKPAYSVPVQDVPLDQFRGMRENDILFIDSSHVAKAGSDVNHLFFNVMPLLATGVFVHLHDIFLPDDYPLDWIRSRHRFWNEQYVFHAFLAFNTEWQTLLSVHQLVTAGELDGAGDAASFWIHRSTGSPGRG